MTRRARALATVVIGGGLALSTAGATAQSAPPAPLGRTEPVRATAQNTAPTRAFEPPTVLIDPSDADTVVAGTIELNSSQCKLLRSRDGGRTWTLLDNTPSPPEFPACFRGAVYGYLNETPMAWGSGGTLYWGISGVHPTRADTDVSVLVARSSDLGDTWTSTLVADGRTVTEEPDFVSRPVSGLAVDARPGRADTVYVAWQTFPATGPRLAKIAVSTDGGRTFSEPRTPYDDQTSARFGGEPGLESLPPTVRVANDGTLYVLFPGRSADTTIPHRLYMARSTDQGRTFTVTEIAEPVEANSTPAFQWSPEGGAQGTLHVVWEDLREGPLGARDIFYARSVDGGATFSPTRKITDDDPRQRFSQFNPNLSIAPDGRLDVVWWDFRDGAELYANDVYYAYSTDQGNTWSRNFRVTDQSIDRRVGTWSNNYDYRAPPAVASRDETALIMWDDTRLSRDGVATQDVFSSTVQLEPLPAEGSVLPYLVAGVGGLVAAGVALVLIAAASRRRGPPTPREKTPAPAVTT